METSLEPAGTTDPAAPTEAGGANPVTVYLARLTSAESRRAMATSLELLAELLVDGHPADRTERARRRRAGSPLSIAVPWHELCYGHTQALRSWLAEHCSPAAANRHLAALRGVLREAWRLGLMNGEDLARAVDLAGDISRRCSAGGLEEAGLIQPQHGHTVQAARVLHQRPAVLLHRPHHRRPANPKVAGDRRYRVGILADPPTRLGPARSVSTARGRIAAAGSVQVRTPQAGSRQRQSRLRLHSTAGRPPIGRSRTRTMRRPWIGPHATALTADHGGVAPTSFGRHWIPAATIECGRQWSPAVTDGSEEPQVVGSPAHAAGLMPVGDSDCRPTGRGRRRRGSRRGQQPASVTTGDPARKPWRIMTADPAIDGH